MLINLLSLSALIGLTLLLILYVYQDRLIFFPVRALSATPADVGLAYQDVHIETEDGVGIHGWWVPADGPLTVLYFHGNAGNISHRLDTLAFLHDLDLSVLIIDYRGYGRSQGKPSQSGIERDASAAWRYLTLTRGIAAGSILLFGRSLGGAAALSLAAQRPGGMWLESTFASLADMGRRHYPWLPVALLLKADYPNLERVRHAGPVVIAHSERDEIVPFEHGKRLFAAAGEPKWLLTLSGSHNMRHSDDQRRYRDCWQGMSTLIAEPQRAQHAEHMSQVCRHRSPSP